MTGLEAILDQIQQEAARQAEELLSAARTEAESTLAAAGRKPSGKAERSSPRLSGRRTPSGNGRNLPPAWRSATSFWRVSSS